MSDNSDILKNAIKRQIPITGIASIVATTLLPQPFTTVFQIISHNHVHTATKTSCTRDTFNGQIWKCILNHHFSIFLGTNTFMMSIVYKSPNIASIMVSS